jgi:hypothetical protein
MTMLDQPPVVDFSIPPSEVAYPSAQRELLALAVKDLAQTSSDVGGYGREGALFASYAACWAAALMVADIIKIGLKAGDRRARLLFDAQDQAVQRANKLIKAMGGRPLPQKADVLKSVDPQFNGVVGFLDDVKKSREFLKKHKAKEPKEVSLLLDLGIAMTEDSVLILDAGTQQQRSVQQAAAAQAQIRAKMARLQSKIAEFDREMTRMIERGQRLSNIA